MPKISELPSTSSPTTADSLPIVQSGTTKKTTLDDLPIPASVQTALNAKTTNAAAAITGGTITGITDLAVADGGTGASTAAGARTNLGAAASGTNTDITSMSALVGPGLLPVGSVIHVCMNTPPIGFLKANGTAVSRSTYATLFATIGTTFGTGDGSTTFNLPDLRGEFIRGWDDGRGVDAGRAIGSTQAQSVQAHQHATNFAGDQGSVNYGNDGSPAPRNSVTATGTTSGALTAANASGAETRPRNVALLACIKY